MTNSPAEPAETEPVAWSSAPRVSVVMPVKDVEDWISESVYSILSQTMSNLELIIVDDGSADQTLEIVRRLQRDDARVRIVTNLGSGAASARNTGIGAARGTYLAFADGDDIVPSRAYETMLASLDASGSEMVVGNYMILTPQNVWTRQSNLPIYGTPQTAITIAAQPRLLRDRVCWNRLVSRRGWNEAGISFVESPRSNDIVAMVQTYCAFTFDVIPDVVYGYRRRLGTTSISASRLAPSSTIAHLQQELLCIQALERLGDADVIRAYFAGILEHDLWAHGAHLMRMLPRSTPELAPQRELLHEVLTHAPDEALDDLPELKRLSYAFARAQQWNFAAAAASARDYGDDVIAALEGSSLAEFVTSAHELATAVNGVLVDAFRAAGQPVLSYQGRQEITDDDVIRVVDSLREAQRAGVPRNRLTPLEIALISAPIGTDAQALRALCEAEHTASPAPRRTVKSRVAGALRRGRSAASRLRPRSGHQRP